MYSGGAVTWLEFRTGLCFALVSQWLRCEAAYETKTKPKRSRNESKSSREIKPRGRYRPFRAPIMPQSAQTATPKLKIWIPENLVRRGWLASLTNHRLRLWASGPNWSLGKARPGTFRGGPESRFRVRPPGIRVYPDADRRPAGWMSPNLMNLYGLGRWMSPNPMNL